MGVRLRLYGCERMRRERLIGETVVSFANINLELENNCWLNLEPRANTTVSIILVYFSFFLNKMLYKTRCRFLLLTVDSLTVFR